jgi:hypothetical protein
MPAMRQKVVTGVALMVKKGGEYGGAVAEGSEHDATARRRMRIFWYFSDRQKEASKKHFIDTNTEYTLFSDTLYKQTDPSDPTDTPAQFRSSFAAPHLIFRRRHLKHRLWKKWRCNWRGF